MRQCEHIATTLQSCHDTAPPEDLTMNLNQLPDDCLIVIFEKFSLQHQISLRLVCSKWQQIIQMEICRRKQSLKLFGSYQELVMYCKNFSVVNFANESFKLKRTGKDDDLIVTSKHFSRQTCQLLARLFPNVKRLLVNFHFHSAFVQLPYLLQLWSHQLVSLSLCGWLIHPDVCQQIYLVLKQLHSLRKLDFLMLGCACSIDEPHEERNSNFDNIVQVLSRLEHVSILQECDIVPVMSRLSDHCKYIFVDNLTNDKLTRVLLDNKSNFYKSIQHFRITNLIDANVLRNVCSHFHSLTALDIEFAYKQRFTPDFIRNLAQLSNLTALELENIIFDEASLSENFPVIPSLQILSIYEFQSKSLQVYDWTRLLFRIFPNLRQISIKSNDESVLQELGDSSDSLTKLVKCEIYFQKFKVDPVFDYIGRHESRYLGDILNNQDSCFQCCVT